MAKIIIIQGSLNKNAKTAIVINEVAKELLKKTSDFHLIDLRELNMEFCDGRKIEEYNKDMQQVYRELEKAKGYIIGMPVYQKSVPGPLKNFLDITAKAMKNKTAAIVCNAGSKMSYLAAAELAKILAFEENVTTVQPVVFTAKEDFTSNILSSEKVKEKIKELLENFLKKI